jgi:hypothetical protein
LISDGAQEYIVFLTFDRWSPAAFDTHITMSKDGKYIIHKTVITDSKLVKYYEKVLKCPK